MAETSFEEGVNAFFGKEGFQVGFEAAGVQASLDALMAHVEKGGDIVILGCLLKESHGEYVLPGRA